MRVKWVKQSNESINDITNFISITTWGGSASQASRTLEISILHSPHDKNIANLDIKLGDRLKLYSDDNKLLIDAMVYNRERNNDTGTLTFSGYDDLNHLLKSKSSYNFKNITPEKITKKICNELKVSVGKIAKTDVNIKKMLVDAECPYDIIIKAYTKAYRSKGVKYMPIMNGRKLYIIEKGEVIENFVLSDNYNITSSSYSESLDSMINKVKIYNDKGKKIGEVEKSSWISAYGIFQDIYTKEDGVNAHNAAKKLLTGIDKKASVEALGNIHCISGYGVQIKDSITKLTGTFWIESDSHTWENGVHKMSLDLAFKNIMEVVS